MSGKPDNEKKLDDSAETALKQYAKDYAAAILLNAKIIAYRNNAKKIALSHVEEAIEHINKTKKRQWSKDLLITVGGAFFGAFVQGFITELSSGNSILVAVYVMLGFAGVLMVFWGISR